MTTTTLSLTIKPGYSRWGVWEIIRENAQNARDAHILGHAMHVSFVPESQTLTFHNDHASIGRETLILGVSTKRGDSASAGEMGEGYKIAAEAAMEHGIGFVMLNGEGERWTFQSGWSDDFNTDLLQIVVEDVDEHDGVTVTLTGVTEEQWLDARSRLRFLGDEEDEQVHVSNDDGSILIGDDVAGQLYVKGIWVCKLHGKNWTFGYDLNNVQLDRDRSIPCQYTLNRAIRTVINNSVKDGSMTRDQLWELFRGESEEAKQFNNEYIEQGDAHKAVAARFFEEHGEDAVPFTTPEEQSRAIAAGLKPVFVSNTVKTMLKGHVRNLDDALAERQFEVSCFHSADDLRKKERENLEWAMYMVASSESWIEGCVQIADFYGSGIMGRFCRNEDGDVTIQIARKVLRNPAVTAETLIHEACHIYGDDGTPAHSRAMQKMSGELMSRFAR